MKKKQGFRKKLTKKLKDLRNTDQYKSGLKEAEIFSKCAHIADHTFQSIEKEAEGLVGFSLDFMSIKEALTQTRGDFVRQQKGSTKFTMAAYLEKDAEGKIVAPGAGKAPTITYVMDFEVLGAVHLGEPPTWDKSIRPVLMAKLRLDKDSTHPEFWDHVTQEGYSKQQRKHMQAMLDAPLILGIGQPGEWSPLRDFATLVFVGDLDNPSVLPESLDDFAKWMTIIQVNTEIDLIASGEQARNQIGFHSSEGRELPLTHDLKLQKPDQAQQAAYLKQLNKIGFQMKSKDQPKTLML